MRSILLLAAPFALVGLLVGRWWAAALPLVGWPIYFLGLNAGWWGSGVGDLWEVAMGLLITSSVLFAGGGVLIRVALARGFRKGSV